MSEDRHTDYCTEVNMTSDPRAEYQCVCKGPDQWEREARELLVYDGLRPMQSHPVVARVAAALRERSRKIVTLQEDLHDGETDRQAAEDMQRLAGKYMDERDAARAQVKGLRKIVTDLLIGLEGQARYAPPHTFPMLCVHAAREALAATEEP